jgi:hypothetical protein
MRPKDAVRRRRLEGGVPSAGRGSKGGGGWVELTGVKEEGGNAPYRPRLELGPEVRDGGHRDSEFVAQCLQRS